MKVAIKTRIKIFPGFFLLLLINRIINQREDSKFIVELKWPVTPQKL